MGGSEVAAQATAYENGEREGQRDGDDQQNPTSLRPLGIGCTFNSDFHFSKPLGLTVCCYLRQPGERNCGPSSSKFHPRVAHKRPAMLEWHLPPLNFTIMPSGGL